VASLQDMYVRLLLDRVRDENYPNPEHLDRIEGSLRTPDQLREYVVMLLAWVQRTKRPSPALLDRIERFVTLEQRARKRA
jgi:hypothetical protein